MNLNGQTYIDSSHTQRQIDAEILTHPPSHLSIKLNFSSKIDKILFCFNHVFSKGILALLPFSLLEHADILRIPLVETVVGTVRMASVEKLDSIITDKNQIWSSQKQIQQPCHIS